MGRMGRDYYHARPDQQTGSFSGDRRSLQKQRVWQNKTSQRRDFVLFLLQAKHPVESKPRVARLHSNLFYPRFRSEEHTSELQSRFDLVCRLLLEKKKKV